jgi:polyhydroxybutyrate depolymerase
VRRGLRAWRAALPAVATLITVTTTIDAGAATTTAIRAQAPAACGAVPTRGSRQIVLPVDGQARAVLLHVPFAAAGARLPLVLAFHGFGGSGIEMERETGLSTLANSAGFIVAYPIALGGRWSIHVGVRSERDVDLARATIEYVAARYCTDASRVYAVGVSNGGSQAVHVACELSDEIAAAAFVAGDYRAADGCKPVKPVSVLEIHGLDDNVVPYRGFDEAGGAGAVFGFLNLWEALDRCAAPPTHTRVAPHMLELAWRCATGTRVAHVKVFNFGHAWPGADPPPGRLPGPGSATTLLWRFFSTLQARFGAPGAAARASP